MKAKYFLFMVTLAATRAGLASPNSWSQSLADAYTKLQQQAGKVAKGILEHKYVAELCKKRDGLFRELHDGYANSSVKPRIDAFMTSVQDTGSASWKWFNAQDVAAHRRVRTKRLRLAIATGSIAAVGLLLRYVLKKICSGNNEAEDFRYPENAEFEES